MGPDGASDHVVLRFDADSANRTNVITPSHYISVGENGVTAEGLKNMLAADLAATAANRSVTIDLDSTSYY